jgi:hypothetical protein
MAIRNLNMFTFGPNPLSWQDLGVPHPMTEPQEPTQKRVQKSAADGVLERAQLQPGARLQAQGQSGIRTRPPLDRSRREGVARWTLLVGLLAALATGLALSWFDVLPGSYTLHGWVEPHASREAREWRDYREERLALFREDTGTPTGAVAFLGSSTIERMPLEAFAAPCVGRGIGMEPIAQLRDRLTVGLPDELGGIVLYMASIDFRRDRSSPARTRAIATEIFDRLDAERPGVPIVVIGILPEVELADDMLMLLADTNLELADLCRDRGATFVRTDRGPLQATNKSLAGDFTDDGLHLNQAGYRVLARWLIEDGGATGAILGG